MVTLRRFIDWLFRQYKKLKAADAVIAGLQTDKHRIEAQLSVCQVAKRHAIDRCAELVQETVIRAAERDDLYLQLNPDPPSSVEVVPYATSYGDLRLIFPFQLVYGFDDIDNEVPLVLDVLRALEQMKVYEYEYEAERRDCENFSKGIKGRFALAPGWTGFLVLNIEFRLPPDPLLGIRAHSEVLFYAKENREGYTQVNKWFVFEGQSKSLLEIAAEMFEDDTSREAYLMK